MKLRRLHRRPVEEVDVAQREKRTARGDERTTTVGYRPDGTSTVSRRIAGNCPVSPVGLVLLVVPPRPPDGNVVVLPC